MLLLRSSISMGMFLVLIYKTVDTTQKGFINIKDALLNWNYGQKYTGATCAASNGRILNLLNLVCSTAQALNTTARDGCYGCFSRYTSLPQGQQQLLSLSLCASMYFTNTTYGPCATRLMTLATNSAIYTPTNGQCTNAYCEFVRCLRMTNSNNVIAQCAREVRALTPINITLDNDNVRYYTNMTSCILAKARCNSYNPITGEPQVPGSTISGQGKKQVRVALVNTLNTSPDGTLRIVGFPASLAITTSFCSVQTTLNQPSWLNNECPFT